MEPGTVLTRIETEHSSKTKVFSLPAPLFLPFLGFFFTWTKYSHHKFLLSPFRVQEFIRLTRFPIIHLEKLGRRNLIDSAPVQSAAVRWAEPKPATLMWHQPVVSQYLPEKLAGVGGGPFSFQQPEYKLIPQEVYSYYNILRLISDYWKFTIVFIQIPHIHYSAKGFILV